MTTTTELCKVNGELIKTDCTGRIRVSPEHREQLLDTFESSGMSGMGFAKYCGVKYPTFASWVQKRKRERNQYPPQHDTAPENLLGSLAEVKIEPGCKTTAAEICIELPGGAILRLGHPAQAPLAAALIDNLTRQNNA
jgi:hypothetical protein